MIKHLNKCIRIVVCLATLVSPVYLKAKTSTWKITGHGNTMYLGGTIHFLSARDFPLPCQFDTAYARAGKIFFEADVRGAHSPAAMQRYAGLMTYQDGTGLMDKLSARTAQNLKELLARSNIPIQAVATMKPGVLLTVLTASHLQRLGITPGGVDNHYLRRATSDGVAVGFLESLESQIGLLSQMGVGNEEKFVRYLIESMSQLQSTFGDIVRHWRAGEIGALAQASQLDQMRTEYPLLFKDLLTDRNNRWLTQIEQLMKSAQIEYVLVGALHMASDIGLLAQLKERGYKVEALSGCQ